jgi:hypothetical protein
MAYSKGDFAESLGISRGELEKRARDAGFSTTEEYYNATRGTGKLPQQNDRAQIDDFMSRWTGAIANQPTMGDIWKRLSGEFGIDKASENYRNLAGMASGLQQQFEQTPEQVASESRGYDVNAAQQARLTQARQGDVLRNLTPIAREAGIAGQNLNTLTGQAMNQLGAEQYQLEKELQPYLTEAELLNSALARQLSYYTVDRQRELDLLLKKLEGEQAISLEELEQIGDLAELERQYEISLRDGGGSSNTGW